MNMSDFNFVPVKLRSLPVDVHLDCKVYFEKPLENVEQGEPDSELILLCENQTITQELTTRLKRAIFPKNKVYITHDYVVNNLFDKGHFLGYSEQEVADIRAGKKPWESNEPKAALPKKKIAKVKKLSGIEVYKDKIYELEKVIDRYDKVKSGAADMLSKVAESGKIDKEQSELISKDIQTQLVQEDSSLILYALNQIRTEDEYLHTHSLNVAYLNGLVGKWLKLSAEQQSELVEIGLFHDLGKLKIDPKVLNKPGKLTEDEFEEIKRHPVISLELLMKSGVRNKVILEGVIQHHEKVNGLGYPKGLGSKSISDFAKITSISDIYDAMVTKRVYKEPVSPFVILNEFMKTGYSELDIKYINIFVNCMIDELKGKVIIMNDGTEATIRLVNPRKVLYPIVEIDGDVVTTDDNLFCSKMKNLLE
ncbi:MAG: HD domain-containing protein [Oscillospiraceae bacterium]|nr:HD domain-containing protein [Oscillospiraceae bacterium]